MSEEIISVTREHIQELLPARLVYSKKGDNGIVLVIGGSGIYHGAPLLSTLLLLFLRYISILGYVSKESR